MPKCSRLTQQWHRIRVQSMGTFRKPMTERIHGEQASGLATSIRHTGTSSALTGFVATTLRAGAELLKLRLAAPTDFASCFLSMVAVDGDDGDGGREERLRRHLTSLPLEALGRTWHTPSKPGPITTRVFPGLDAAQSPASPSVSSWFPAHTSSKSRTILTKFRPRHPIFTCLRPSRSLFSIASEVSTRSLFARRRSLRGGGEQSTQTR